MRLISIILFSFIISYSIAQTIPVVSADQLFKQLESSKNNLTVVNFWATWCAPCIKELPYFEEIHGKNGVSVLLVNLDFSSEHAKVEKFVDKKQLKAPVLRVDVKDYDSFMTSINKNWSGAIPATLFIDKKGAKYFHEGDFTKEELNSTIAKYLK